MFVQVIRGKTKDPAAAKAALDSWSRELKPGAKGFLGSTSGVTDDGKHIIVVRFESEEAARANSDRPEQGEWFRGTGSKAFDGEPAFHDCPDVRLIKGGGSDAAGFVQVMVYKPRDLEGVKKLIDQFGAAVDRPDFIGASTSIATDGTVIDTNYFTSEAEARKAEKQEVPAEMRDLMKRFMDAAGSIEYLDLHEPWFDSP